MNATCAPDPNPDSYVPYTGCGTPVTVVPVAPAVESLPATGAEVPLVVPILGAVLLLAGVCALLTRKKTKA